MVKSLLPVVLLTAVMAWQEVQVRPAIAVGSVSGSKSICSKRPLSSGTVS